MDSQKNTPKYIFRVIFVMRDLVCEVYAEHVSDAPIFGFIEVSGFLFNQASPILIDTSEEKLRAEFSGVKQTLIPINDILRIDKVEKMGQPKMTSAEGSTNVTFMPQAALQRSKRTFKTTE